jgi:hypothetical protein
MIFCYLLSKFVKIPSLVNEMEDYNQLVACKLGSDEKRKEESFQHFPLLAPGKNDGNECQVKVSNIP